MWQRTTETAPKPSHSVCDGRSEDEAPLQVLPLHPHLSRWDPTRRNLAQSGRLVKNCGTLGAGFSTTWLRGGYWLTSGINPATIGANRTKGAANRPGKRLRKAKSLGRAMETGMRPLPGRGAKAAVSCQVTAASRCSPLGGASRFGAEEPPPSKPLKAKKMGSANRPQGHALTAGKSTREATGRRSAGPLARPCGRSRGRTPGEIQRAATAWGRAAGVGACVDAGIEAGRRREPRAQGRATWGSLAAAMADLSQRRSFFISGSFLRFDHGYNLPPVWGMSWATKRRFAIISMAETLAGRLCVPLNNRLKMLNKR